METNQFPEETSGGADDSSSNDVALPPTTEDTEPEDVSQNIQSTDSLGSSAVPDTSLQRGRRQARSRRAMSSGPSQRAARQSRAVVPKRPTSKLSFLIFTAVATYQKKSGLSLQSLKKIMINLGYDMAKKKHYFLRSIKNMVDKGQLWQVKGNGATGSFKVNPELEKKKKQPKVRGKSQKTKNSTKKKNGRTKSKNGRNNAKKQGRVVSSKKVSRRSRMPSLQAVQSQVKV